MSLYFESMSDSADLWGEDCIQETENNVIMVNKVPDKIIDHHHQSYEWIFGKSPKFTKQIRIDRDNIVSLTVEKGVIKEIEGSVGNELIGLRYNPDSILQLLTRLSKREVL